ncbi:non-homologous end-joining DNA ligase [Streptomyces poonensis]|uniref:DNA ligase (ATP) n=1 Tax=Streptomyces poonensis TaxID=68255 RepID=A0A918PDW4_9ACTN|nr:non-homologous end-joining DNA ligase [Streptomyces poonensis]GGZ02591.1 ATP-dependent DNA ligase [Streptomyces poonensis]GLJ93212.1 ATP-dependent DNA ligase [Streptomyces poonensis]
MSELLATLPADRQQLLSPARPGAELASRPMAATLTDRRDFSGDWIFERKLDGIRALAVLEGDRVALYSRTGNRLDATYPEIVEALAAQECEDFTVDGEIVAFSGNRTDFGLLQQRMGLTRRRDVEASPVVVTYCLFDLLRLDGADTRPLTLRDRKSLLRRALTYQAPLRFTTHRNQGGGDLLAEACDRGWEGLIAKRADSRYQPRRSPDWLKLKCSQGQEFVIGGFTEPAGSRVGFGALLLGYYDVGAGALHYAGKVGTGFDHRTLVIMRRYLEELRVTASPFADRDRIREGTARWVEPCLVAQIAFTEWTRDGMLRHSRFLGLREDKKPQEVVREQGQGRKAA